MDTLYEMNHMDYVIYLWLRRYMDFSTGIVGVKRHISYQMLREILSIPPRNGVQGMTPTLSAIRCSIDRLCKQGLLEKFDENKSLVFRLQLAKIGTSDNVEFLRPVEVQQRYIVFQIINF